MSENKLLVAALRYAELGYPVFPCGADKRPLTRQGFKDATTDSRKIEGWWKRWPDACIGLATARLLVVDIDGAANPWLSGQPEHAADLASAPTSMTPSGGRHHIFRRPEGVKWRCSTGKLAPQVDTRTAGGYIVVPPSTRPEGAYRWVDGIAIEEPPTELPLPPAWLVNALNAILPRTGAEKSTSPAIEPAPSRIADAPLIERAERYIDKMPPAIQGSGGSGATYTAACALVNGFGLDESTALGILTRRYNPRCEPEWSEVELLHKVTDAATKPHERPRGYLRDESLRVEPAPPAAGKTAKPKRAAIEPYVPFPTRLLPEPMREFVEATAAAMRCDASYAALPLLAAAASAIGTTRQLRLKRTWPALAILWTATVGESGTLKTPPFKAAVRALRKRQGRAMKEHSEAERKYLDDVAYYEKALAVWKRSKDPLELPPVKPEPPVAVRYVVSDCTVESLAPILLDNPRGVLMARDELAGWFGSFDKYSGGGTAGSADAAHWLSMHNGEAIIVDRKTDTADGLCPAGCRIHNGGHSTQDSFEVPRAGPPRRWNARAATPGMATPPTEAVDGRRRARASG